MINPAGIALLVYETILVAQGSVSSIILSVGGC
jgi:hypothetical protein